MKRDDFKIGLKVTVDECYLSDEASPDCASETAIVFTEPSDDEELVGIRYEDGSLDYVPQDILEECPPQIFAKMDKVFLTGNPFDEQLVGNAYDTSEQVVIETKAVPHGQWIKTDKLNKDWIDSNWFKKNI